MMATADDSAYAGTSTAAQEKIQAGESVEDVIRFMRTSGLSVVQCMRVLTDVGYSLSDAKDVVHNSQAWADLKDEHEAFHDALIQEVRRNPPW